MWSPVVVVGDGGVGVVVVVVVVVAAVFVVTLVHCLLLFVVAVVAVFKLRQSLSVCDTRHGESFIHLRPRRGPCSKSACYYDTRHTRGGFVHLVPANNVCYLLQKRFTFFFMPKSFLTDPALLN